MPEVTNAPDGSPQLGREMPAPSPSRSLRDLLESNARWHADAPAVVENGVTETWAMFAARVRKIGANLARLGAGHGSRVGVVDANSADLVAMYWACAWLGAVIVPLNWRLTSSELAYVIERSRPEILVIGELYAETSLAALEQAELAAEPLLIASRGGEVPGALAWSEALECEVSPPELAPIDWHDPHVIIFTSGSTGRPKGVVSSHRRTLLDHLHQALTQNVRPGERFLCYLPLFHAAAWAMMGPYLAWGGAVVLSSADPGALLDTLDREECTGTFAVPIVLRDLVAHPRFDDVRLPRLRRIVYASFDQATFMREIFDRLVERGATELTMAHSYGLTEAGPCVSYLPPELWEQAPSSVGFPPPGITVALLDDNLREVPAGERGEICVRSPTLMDGYLDDPEATAEAFAGGWLHSGDIGEIGPDGLLYIVDRKKDLIRTAAENVAPKEVEAVLGSHPAVRECAIVGIPDDRYEERIVACVVLVDRSVTAAELDQHVRRDLAGFKCPKSYEFVYEIPKTSVGKIAKQQVRALMIERA
jgi:acyl-CoA synthetase (AMP-forming)/AMP-acid ligase II